MTLLRSILITLLLAVPALADIDSNKVGAWTFDVDGTATVGPNATLVGNTTVVAGGKLRSAIAVDGTDDYANLTTIASSDGASAFTYSVWIYPTALGDFDQVLTKFVSSTSRAGLELGGSGAGGNDDLLVNVSTGASRNGYTTENLLTTNTWHHVVVVFNGAGSTDADKLKLYVNGTQRTLTLTAGIPATMMNTPTEEWRLGWRDDSPAGFAFTGRLDHAEMWSREFNASEVMQLYVRTKSPKQAVVGQ